MSHVTLDKLLNISVVQFSYQQNDMIVPTT